MSNIRITLLSDLCSGSGESRGNAVDSDIAVDRNGFPVIPARRIKGVLAEAAYDLLKKVKNLENAKGFSHVNQENIEKLFGNRFGTEGTVIIKNAEIEHADQMKYWLNHETPDILKETATPAGISEQFTYVRGQTRIDENGIADHGSLRFTRVVSHHNPFDYMKETVFSAPVLIQEPNEELNKLLEDCCRAVRHIGTHRNRGLGEVRLEYIRDVGTYQNKEVRKEAGNDEQVILTYRVRIDSPLTIPETDGVASTVPARSVIGCMAFSWLKLTGKDADSEEFRDLFLNGTTVWSGLTPCCGGQPTIPVPLAVTKLKNRKKDNGETLYCNRLSSEGKTYAGEKQTTLEGRFLGQGEDLKWRLVSVPHKAEYHHRHEHSDKPDAPEEQLYMQESIQDGQAFGGTVRAPGRLAGVIRFLLEQSVLNFGRSKSAQYGNCSLLGEVEIRPEKMKTVHSNPGDRVFALLESDLVIAKDGGLVSDASGVREMLMEKLPLREPEQDFSDYCAFRFIGGYQAMWHLQKPVIRVMAAGSCLCFASKGEDLPETVQLGEYRQEGFGLIRFRTEEQMESLTDIREAAVDSGLEENKNREAVNGLVQALILKAAELKIRKCANSWYDAAFRPDGKPDKKEIASFNAGRLRLMLDQSENFDELIGKIMSITLSDASATKAGHRDKYTDLVNRLYGREKTPESRIRQMLHADETQQNQELFKLVMESPLLQKEILSLWKLPLATILYRLHYEQKGGARP